VRMVTEETEPDADGEKGPALSDLDIALLGLLSVRPTSGYDIRQHYARALAPWWETPRTQIYPRLRDLQKRGLIDHEYVVQQDRPNKRLFSITPAGRQALTDRLSARLAWPDMRHHMMMRLFFGNLLPVPVMRKQLLDYRDRMDEWTSNLRAARNRFAESLGGPYGESVFFELLSLEHLIAMAELERKGADAALAAIEKGVDILADAEGADPSRLLEVIREMLD
jgi:PadR family transcriptional regulator AphA